MAQLRSHLMDLYDNLYWGVFKKSIEKIQFWLRVNKNIILFILRPK